MDHKTIAVTLDVALVGRSSHPGHNLLSPVPRGDEMNASVSFAFDLPLLSGVP